VEAIMQSNHASPLGHLDTSLAERYRAIRAQTMALTAPLSAEDCALQSMPDASPVKWHLAHATWFFETFILAPTQADYRMFDPAYRVLFNSYYHGVGDKHPRPERGMLSRPAGCASMAEYRPLATKATASASTTSCRATGSGWSRSNSLRGR
jgi:hypothetical protein